MNLAVHTKILFANILIGVARGHKSVSASVVTTTPTAFAIRYFTRSGAVSFSSRTSNYCNWIRSCNCNQPTRTSLLCTSDSVSTNRNYSDNSTTPKIINQHIASTTMEEVKIQCSDGIQLAAKHYKSMASNSSTIQQCSQRTKRIVCLHGWLDNAASFHLLAPALLQQQQSKNNNNNVDDISNMEILSLDFPGHGHSSHKSMDGPTQLISEYSYYVHEALVKVGWIHEEEVTTTTTNNNNVADGKTTTTASSTNTNTGGISFIGHSMGAAVSLIYAAAFPEHVDKVVLLDGAGPLARNTADISRHVRSAISQRIGSNMNTAASSSSSKSINGARIYSSLNLAIRTRVSTARMSPGNQYISKEAAEAMVGRATSKANPNASTTQNQTVNGEQTGEGVVGAGVGVEELSPSTYNGPIIFRHDPRLKWPSLHYFTSDQVDALYQDVQCPVCLLQAQDGWPITSRTQESVETILQPTILKKLPGSHHFHADPDTSGRVIDEVVKFLLME